MQSMPGESRPAYVKRRRAWNADFKARLRPRLSQPACQIVTLPPKGADQQADDAVAQGKIRQVSVIDPAGNRVGRTKGVPYRRYPAVMGLKRRDHRALERAGLQ